MVVNDLAPSSPVPGHLDDAVVPDEAARQLADLVQYRELLGCIWLYVDWKCVTTQLTTEQKELWADAVDATGDPEYPGPKVDRWWRS